MDWARILACITGTVNQELFLRNEYLAAENLILKAQLKTPLRLTEAISLGTSRWCLEYSKTHVRNGSVELWRENAIAIMDEKTVAMVRGDGFSQLLECPSCGGAGRYIAVNNPPSVVFDNH